MARCLAIMQGGGPTAVINATLAGILGAASSDFDRVYGLLHSFEGGHADGIVDLSDYRTPTFLAKLERTPGAFLGSSRRKVDHHDLPRILDDLDQKHIDHIIGIGGNGTMAGLQILSDVAKSRGRDLAICGVPKTVDNDLPSQHVCPGYGSAARFVALAVRDFGYDFRAMSTFDDITILETMGRHTGWLAAASVLLKETERDPPHLVLLPEQALEEETLLQDIASLHRRLGHVFIVVNEMLTDPQGKLIGETFQKGPTDSLGRRMYSLSLGTGNYLADLIWRRLGLQTRCLRPGGLGRAMSSMVSTQDRNLANEVGREAVARLASGDAVEHIVTIKPAAGFGLAPLEACTGMRTLPERFMDDTPTRMTGAFLDYARPLIGSVEPLASDLRL